MRAIKEGVMELERQCVPIHLLEEVFDIVGMVVELVRANPLNIFLVIPLLLEEEFAEILC